jgi:hypothetical protein
MKKVEKIDSNPEIKAKVDSLNFAKFFFGLADLARADMHEFNRTGWNPKCLSNAVRFCHIALLILAEEAFKLDEFRECVGTIRKIYWNPSYSLEARLWSKRTFDRIFDELMPEFDWKYTSKLNVSKSPDAIVERQRLLTTYNRILVELKNIRSAGIAERKRMIQELKTRYKLPGNFRHLINRPPSEVAWDVIHTGHPGHPGKGQLKHILVRARQEKRFFSHLITG